MLVIRIVYGRASVLDSQSAFVAPLVLDMAHERGGAGAPVGQEHAEADGLEDAGKSADGDGVERALLGQYLSDELCTRISC